MLSAVQIIMDLLVRGGVPATEFRAQFDLVKEKLKPYPDALRIIDSLDRYTRQRLNEWPEQQAEILRTSRTQGSA
jgi:hypothetical protein